MSQLRGEVDQQYRVFNLDPYQRNKSNDRKEGQIIARNQQCDKAAKGAQRNNPSDDQSFLKPSKFRHQNGENAKQRDHHYWAEAGKGVIDFLGLTADRDGIAWFERYLFHTLFRIHIHLGHHSIIGNLGCDANIAL